VAVTLGLVFAFRFAVVLALVLIVVGIPIAVFVWALVFGLNTDWVYEALIPKPLPLRK